MRRHHLIERWVRCLGCNSTQRLWVSAKRPLGHVKTMWCPTCRADMPWVDERPPEYRPHARDS